MDCGPASLCMITDYHGKSYSLYQIRKLCGIAKDGVSLQSIINAAKKIGLEKFSAKVSVEQLVSYANELPCILFWNKNHFLVLENITIRKRKRVFHIVDPAYGRNKLTEEKFKKFWLIKNTFGVALFLNPSPEFFKKKIPVNKKRKLLLILKSLFFSYRKRIFSLLFFVLFGTILNIILPFLTEALIDRGVEEKNINVISVILFAQLFVFVGIMIMDVLRNWYTLLIGSRFSIDIISSYLSKVLKLPISFFDTRNTGDFSQRIQDNMRIEKFFTSDSILTIFSIVILIVYSIILLYYDFYLFLLYFCLTILAVYWSIFWLKKRKNIDYQLFSFKSETQDAVFEFFNGIREMKLNQFEEYKKKEWINLQENLFKVNIKSLKIEQIQSIGFSFFNQLKNILVTFLGAYYVIKGNMTLGSLLAVSFIIGQMNSPVHQLLLFFRSQQDAFLSFNRLGEVFREEEEEDNCNKSLNLNDGSVDIILKDISFKYNINDRQYVLRNINLKIPKGKITAIVGHSGSGKTTLMKLLLKFFPPTSGDIFFEKDNIKHIKAKSIRENSGVVLQDGYIFNDTIQKNIITKNSKVDKEKFNSTLETVNLLEFVNSLVLKDLTKIGSGGNDLSGGQKQRLLIARAIYKNPIYFFLDEATSSLDSTNERKVHDKLQEVFKEKTVVIIAHRLSTVQNAHQIVVLSDGEIVEVGKHNDLIKRKSHYFKLVKDQLNI